MRGNKDRRLSGLIRRAERTEVHGRIAVMTGVNGELHRVDVDRIAEARLVEDPALDIDVRGRGDRFLIRRLPKQETARY